MASDLEKILTRVKEKRQAFKQYNFSFLEDDALKTFFDLAQEYETLDNFYRVVVSVIKEFFNLEARLYLMAPEDRLEVVVDSLQGLYSEKPLAPPSIHLENHPYGLDNSWLLPVRGNLLLVDRLPFYAKEQLIGMLEVFPADRLNEHSRFFLEKYANRLGYNLHSKIIQVQNIQHIRFINSLVADIEHNVIIPNISLSLYLRHLRDKIKTLKQLECTCRFPDAPEAQEQFHHLVAEMEADYKALEQQYKGVSLFIESLFRPSHFQRGQLVLRRKPHRVQQEIIEPQLQMFLPRIKERHIEIDVGLGGVPADEEILLSVDKGLMSQVYANLFSNAVKYTRTNRFGLRYLSYGREILKDYFGPNKDGVKFNVFTTGPHIPMNDQPRIFDEGYRGSNVDGEVGTGRGLYFVRNVIETHGGVVGYEPTWEGNNFYFILPLVTTPEGPLSVELVMGRES
jgi:signal transduction histidine kinase